MTAFTRTVNDTLSLGDDLILTHVLHVAEDGVGLSESMVVASTIVVSEAGMGLSDSEMDLTEGSVSSVRRTITDAMGLDDSGQAQGWAEDLDEGLGLTDASLTAQIPSAMLYNETGMTDVVYAALHRGVTINDPIGLTESLSSYGYGIAGLETISDLLGLTDSVSAVKNPAIGVGGVYLFRPPTVKEHPIGIGRLFSFYGMHRGISILITDGVIVEKRWPTTDEVAAADTVYLGGHEYYLNAADAAVLENAGYGGNLTAVDVYVDTYEGSY